MKLQMKREALEKLNRRAGEMARVAAEQMCTVTRIETGRKLESPLE